MEIICIFNMLCVIMVYKVCLLYLDVINLYCIVYLVLFI